MAYLFLKGMHVSYANIVLTAVLTCTLMKKKGAQ